MKKTLQGVLIIIAFFGFASPAFCADVAKIGIFNLQKIVMESSAGKLMQKEAKEKHTEFQKKLNTEKDELQEMQKSLEREALVLSAEKSDEKQRAFRIRVNDFKKMQNDFAKEMKKIENDLKGQIIKETFEIVKSIGEEEGYLIILETQSAGVFYGQEHLDITDKIIKQYNLKVSKAN